MEQTPKEKALEIIKKFSSIGLQQRGEGVECALIHVEGIINEGGTNTLGHGSKYWKEVKQEIETIRKYY